MVKVEIARYFSRHITQTSVKSTLECYITEDDAAQADAYAVCDVLFLLYRYVSAIAVSTPANLMIPLDYSGRHTTVDKQWNRIHEFKFIRTVTEETDEDPKQLTDEVAV